MNIRTEVTGAQAANSASITAQAMDVLMPMHAYISHSGQIKSVGPTLAKLRAGEDLIGCEFLDVFDVKRPIHVTSFEALCEHRAGLMRLQFRGGDLLTLRGVFVPLQPHPDQALGEGEEVAQDMLVNLSFGTKVLDAVQRYDLSSADFAPSDPTVDMLYLMEAKSIALEESKRLNARLEGARMVAEEQAFSDTLTGLQNRRGLDATIDRFINVKMPFALMNLDLDFFKEVNDTYGHAAGDHVLRQVADILLDEVREVDFVARVGGDEFVLVFSRCIDLVLIQRIAGRILARLEIPIIYESNSCKISASLGTTLSTYYTAPTAEAMLADADAALYDSKRQGRARHTVFNTSPEPS